MKSLTTEVFWPAWEWGPYNRPDLRYVSFSYSSDLTTRDNRKCRALIGSDWYQKIWGDRFQISGDQDAKMKFENDHMGFKLATSVGGLGTGERGDRVIVDDPHNVKDGESLAKRKSTMLWFTETLPTRLNDPISTPIVVIMQRVHNEDVSGLILAQELGYEHLMLPMEFEPERTCYSIVRPSYIKDAVPEKVKFNAELKVYEPSPDGDQLRYRADPREDDNELLWPSRMDRQTVERDKKVMGTYAVAGQFQQRPSPRGGGMFMRGWFEIVEEAPETVIARVRGWDLAASKKSTSPYTAGLRMSKTPDGDFFIEDVKRARLSSGGVKKLIKDTAVEDDKYYGRVRISIPQDPGQAGLAQKNDFATALVGHVVHFSPESGDKEFRAEPVSAQAEAGKIFLVRGDWNKEFLDEVALFPMSSYKDQVDALSRAFSQLIKKKTVSVAGPQSVESEQS